MIPEGPVKESDESNVTLFCNILDANPSVLTKVRWYANSTLLKELPDCEETREDLCHIDPSKLLLESIGRGFFYNYSCEGYNAAGWGPRSEDKELLVHYEPGPATLTHFPLIAVKKKSVTFSCSVDDPGYPESNRFRWLRGGRGPLQDIVTKDWTVEPVGLDSRTNYSCYAFNEGGKGVMATVNLEVHAPPFFIKNLPPYTGMLHTSRNANLTCRIECVPRCEISWLKDGVPIEKNDTRYFVKDKYMDASPATGDFESMLSVLHFNMSNWPNNKFDIEGDNANYTCVSTGNTVGPGIKSATYFSIEYAPDNTTVSEEVVYVAENTIPGRVICKSRANPEPTYEWRFNNKTVIRGNALIINTRMKRNDTGRYTCVAYNKHGRSTAETFIDVQFTPRCEIERQEIEDKDTLICTAYGNPEEADFSWSIKGDNETVEWLGNGDHKAFKDKSYYELKEDYAIARTYRCVANNTAGAGTFCEIEVAATHPFIIWWKEQLAWWQRWDTTTLIILVASILVLLLAVIIICCIIICICRRRRRQDKLQEKSSSMADPLTEPGEYENLPFHGLQTAPNKFTTPTTPTNFNNNTNVVRSVPRPKRLNGNISQNTGTAATTIQANYYDEHETETQQPHTQQYYQQQQQQQYSTMPYNRHPATTSASATLPGMQTLIPNSTAANIVRNDAGIIVHNGSNNNTTAATTNTNPHQMTYNLNNCFPKSYTEYYQQQQQQQQQHPHSQQLQQPPQQFSQKFNNAGGIAGASSHLINAIEHDFNTYAVVERQQPPQQSNATKSTNPFLAVSNFKKFDTSGDEDLQAGNYQTASMKRQGKRKTFADKLEDKRFYSLKFTGNSNKQKQQQQQQSNKSSTAAAALNINHSFNGSTSAGLTGGGVFGSLLSSANKCKRHHSFAGGSLGDIDPKGPVRNPHMNFYDPPAYENVNDAVQVHNAAVSDMELPEGLNGSAQTATVLLHPLPYGIAGGSQGPKKKHHQRQHQPKEDLNLIEPERLSIYRSDSGISNSSYECVTPLPSSTQTPGSTPPPGKMPRTPKTPKTPKGHKNQTLAHTAVTAHFNSSHKKPAPRVPPTPLYMNVNDQQPPQQLNSNNISNLERPSSPSSTMATSAYESASSSQNDNTCNDPISLSSTTSLYSGGGGNNKSSLSAINQRCNRHQQPPEISTPEEFEQYQLGHHAHAHSSSSLSVASSVSASGSNAGGRVKCKKQQQQQQRLNGQGALINHMELNKRKSLANNPFLATNPAAATATTCHKKLHRRQTISDPYAHIKHINECRRQSNNTNINNSSSHSSNNNKTHNYCAKSANAFKAATTTTTASDTQSSAPAAATACSPYKSQQQQQTGLQQYNKNQQSTSSLSYSSACNATAATTTSSRQQFATHHQQQMLMHKNAVHNNNNNNNCKIASDDKKRIHNEVIIHVADNEYNVNAVAAKATHDYQDKGEQTFSQPHRSLNCDVVDSVEKKKSYVNQVVRTGHNRSLSNTTKLYTTLEDNANTTTTPSQIEGFMERPVKLPLRKYHSFHFQPTQTVAGQDICKLQQLRLQQQQQHQQSSLESQYSSPDISSTQPYAKQGPLVFRPYKLDENVSFKPIQPSEESEDSIDYVREYVGTVEMFLKDEEKYMDSGDFTNLTQRLKRQEDFLNDPYSSQTSEVEEASSISLREFNADSQTNSLYEDIHFRPPTLAQTNKVTLETVKPSREDLGKGQHFINSPRALNLLKTVIETDSSTTKNEPAEKSSQFIHSPRALNLLKTVIETDAYQSDAEEDQVCQTTAKKVATPRHLEHVSNPHSPKVSSLSRTNQDTSPAKVEPDYSVARCVRRESSSKVSTIRNYSQDSIDSGINSQVYRTSSNTCVRNDSVKSSGSSNVSNYSKTLQNSLDCESNVSANSNTTQHSSMTQSLQDSKNIREYFQNSPKVSTTSKTFDNSENYTFFMDENRNAQSQMISRESTNSPKVSLSSKISGNSGTYALVMDENRNPQTSIDSPQTTNSPKVSTLNRTSQLSEHRKTDLNANRNQQKNTNPQDLHNSTKALSKTRFTQDHKTLSQEAQAYKLSTLSSQTDTTNSPKRSTSFLARKSLVFASSSNKLKDQAEISQLPLEESILTEQDLAKVFKPYKEPKDSNPLDSKRPVSTALNPAASLEALEMLTKSNPDLWTSNQAGSRHNLHQLELFHTLQQQNKKQLSKNSAAQENDEEDLGYSFCEDENDDEEDLEEKQATVSPHVNVIMAANSQTASQVKYVLTQNHGEVHI
ncbi:uncharacterized protein LOC119612879 isoform X2 [Lucilia sericata]|uniref:uncharacterized protein LOC119612879 isoform X2 n=1 Tax=Lucilia sericata TaxID=13632 RepID=UPI0018A7F005|nr:uncharacterized protein LOC119612879 isoform X2 [Lucilia sericata]